MYVIKSFLRNNRRINTKFKIVVTLEEGMGREREHTATNNVLVVIWDRRFYLFPPMQTVTANLSKIIILEE